MRIKNNYKQTVSWFCFDADDALKMIALASGDLTFPNETSYPPPYNESGYYLVRFTLQGGGRELAAGTVAAQGGIVLQEYDINGGQELTCYIDPPSTPMEIE